MIPTWYLLWIVPLSAFFGMMIIALIAAVHDPHDDWEEDCMSWADEYWNDRRDKR